MTTDANFQDPDGFYADLARTLDRLPETEVEPLLMRLVLLLANQVGDADLLAGALTASLPRPAPSPP